MTVDLGTPSQNAVGSATKSWLYPSARNEDVQRLIGSVDAYNPSNLQILEGYLEDQIQGEGYDCLANLAVLKLYQFNPEYANNKIVIKVLLQAIAFAPFDPDFSLCMAMLGERMSPHLSDPNDAQSFEETVELINHLNTLSSLLLSRRFPQFWTLLRSSEPTSAALQPYISEYPDFDALVHRSVGKAVGLTFSRISKLRLRIWLGLEESEKGEKELVDWVEEMGWTVEGDVVSLPKQKELVIKPAAGQTKESISIEQFGRLLATKGSGPSGPSQSS